MSSEFHQVGSDDSWDQNQVRGWTFSTALWIPTPLLAGICRHFALARNCRRLSASSSEADLSLADMERSHRSRLHHPRARGARSLCRIASVPEDHRAWTAEASVGFVQRTRPPTISAASCYWWKWTISAVTTCLFSRMDAPAAASYSAGRLGSAADTTSEMTSSTQHCWSDLSPAIL